VPQAARHFQFFQENSTACRYLELVVWHHHSILRQCNRPLAASQAPLESSELPQEKMLARCRCQLLLPAVYSLASFWHTIRFCNPRPASLRSELASPLLGLALNYRCREN
jgi:hypothetical protein